MSSRIAIVGMACRYPDAADPVQLWENVLAGRQAFRRIPDEHLQDPAEAAKFCSPKAAVIESLEPGGTPDTTDLARWLALEVAARALTDAGFPGGDGLPRQRTRVIMASDLAPEPVGEDDSIAGRIRDQFGLGGGPIADGRCPSSLLAVAEACAALRAGHADAVLVGGVDLSIDRFGASGFWPGQGCGALLLVRQEDAEARRLRSYATIADWRVAPDGRAPDIPAVGYLEARPEAAGFAPRAVIGTIEANIGDTGAAAGLAGVIKTALAVHHQVIPPATGYSETTGQEAAPRVAGTAGSWPADQPVRAAISAMGSDGVSAHLILESSGGPRRERMDVTSVQLVSSRQDCELMLIDAETTNLLRHRIAVLAGRMDRISYAEMADLAAKAERDLAGRDARAAVVASSPERLLAGLAGLLKALAADSVAGAMTARFQAARDLYQTLDDATDASVVAASAAGLRVLGMLGIEAVTAAGYGPGELTSLHWAGGMDEADLIRLARSRGQVLAGAASESTRPPDGQRCYRLRRPVVSTVTGERLSADVDASELLDRRILDPARLGQALERLATGVDLLLEVGPGRALSSLAGDIVPGLPVVALDTGSKSLAGTLSAVAAAYVLGAPVRHDRLFCGRLTRPMPRLTSSH